MEKDPGRIQTHTNGQESRTRRRQEEEGPERTQATALRLPDLGGRDARVSGRPHGEGPRAVSGRRKALAHRSHEGAGRRVGPRQCRAEKNIRKSSERGEKPSPTAVMKELGAEWGRVSAEQKKIYENRQSEAKKEYNAKMQVYIASKNSA